jgi:hypothetical protein
MKRAVTLCLLFVTLGAFAQHPQHHKRDRQNRDQQLSAEQQAVLQSKKMTLALDLTDRQQSELASLLGRQISQRREMRKTRENQPDSLRTHNPEERFKRMDQHMDRQIAFQRDLREILTDTQFEAWKEWRGKERRQHRRHRSRR